MTHLIDVENALLEKGTKFEEINLDEKRFIWLVKL